MLLFRVGGRIKFHGSQRGEERSDCRERWEETDLEARVIREWYWLW